MNTLNRLSVVNFQNPDKWLKMCLHNIASSGKFSTDRTITEYSRQIWNIEPGTIQLPAPYESENNLTTYEPNAGGH